VNGEWKETLRSRWREAIGFKSIHCSSPTIHAFNLTGAVATLFLAAFAVAAWAGEAQPVAADPALEARVTEVASELRCLVCQNQTLADSNAPLAVDLRAQIREQMQKGASERDIVDYMVARYGDFVLYRPPFKATTVLLWAGPLLLMLIGLAALYYRLRRKRADPGPELSDQDRLRAEALLRDPGDAGPR
jgi:cytochrome c-type biogenesis protein CcmH